MNKLDNPKEWLCPMCYKMCKFGTMGCEDIHACPEEKNYVYYMTRRFPNGRLSDKSGIGLSEIANEDKS